MNKLNVTELFTLKWLIFSHVHFTTIEQMLISL